MRNRDMQVCRNASSKEYFIYISERTDRDNEALFVTPEGSIKALKIELFGGPYYASEDDLLSRKLITESQVKKYRDFIEMQRTEESEEEYDEIEKDTIESLLNRASKHLESERTDDSDHKSHLRELNAMNQGKISKIEALADLTEDEIGGSEEGVKMNFIVRLLECLGHSGIDFEHRYKDILIKRGLPQTGTVIVETKSYDKDLIKNLDQLQRYCHEEQPLMGIIANGTEIMIFSYFWRYRPFNERLVYRISRKELRDDNIRKILESILSRVNLKDGSAIENIKEREEEIENAERKVNEIKGRLTEDEKILEAEIEETGRELRRIVGKIEDLKREKAKMTASKKTEIDGIWKEIGYYPLQKEDKKPGFQPKEHKKPGFQPKEDKKQYEERYVKGLNNPNTLISRMKRFIEDRGEVTGEQLTGAVKKLGYKISGSFGASLRALEGYGYVAVQGRGPQKRIISKR